MPLEGKVAIVTGGGRGIGRGEALALAAHGASVIVNAVSQSAEEVAHEINDNGGKAIAFRGSVTDDAVAEQLIKLAVSEFGTLDILVNNAGSSLQKLLHEIEPDEWNALMELNVNGHFFPTRHAAKVMMANRSGRIINTASGSWLRPMGNLAYGVTKAGIASFTWGVAWELRHYNITCNAIAPFGRTQLVEKSRAAYQRMIDSGLVPLDKGDRLDGFPGPEFAAPIVVYLSSDHAGGITGNIVRAGGGKLSIFSIPHEINLIEKDIGPGEPWTMEELIERVPADLLSGISPWWVND
jgi:NAD(P)-dependent dehydrogenase (short-subunit alcohol dehydrogenase family)